MLTESEYGFIGEGGFDWPFYYLLSTHCSSSPSKRTNRALLEDIRDNGYLVGRGDEEFLQGDE